MQSILPAIAKAPRWNEEPEPFVDGLLEWLEVAGAHRYDDVVSQAEHALQCAALALGEGAPGAETAAALLHDVGHLLMGESNHGRDLEHEQIGADWLARAFGPEVTEPVRHHVAAKRYLCAVDPDYLRSLSDGSIASLALQGGPMSEIEIERFTRLASMRAAVTLRRRDEASKVSGLEVPGFDSHRALLIALLER